MTNIRGKKTTAPSEQAQHGNPVGENIAAVHDFYGREERQRSVVQRHAESVGGFVGRPAFLLISVLFVVAWVGANSAMLMADIEPFDVTPFHWLQGIIGFAALLITTVVVIKQNRLDKLDEQRAQLALKVTLMIEQKTAKLIDLIEELRRDLPNVRDRRDASAEAMQSALSAEGIRAVLDTKMASPLASTAAPIAEKSAPVDRTSASELGDPTTRVE